MKKQVIFTVLLTIVSMVLWILGELAIIFVFHFGGKASIIWTVFMVVMVFAVSIWYGFRSKNDDNSRNW